jgi:hypothetical protein
MSSWPWPLATCQLDRTGLLDVAASVVTVHLSGAGPRYGPEMIKGLLLLAVVFLLATFPATWLLMLFLGNLHLGLSYWGTLPLGILVSVLLGASGTQWDLE